MKLDFGLYSTALPESAKKAWPYDFGVVYSVTLSNEGLRTVVNVRNEGKESLEFQFLLHTYLRVKVSFHSRMASLGIFRWQGEQANELNLAQFLAMIQSNIARNSVGLDLVAWPSMSTFTPASGPYIRSLTII